VGFAFIGILGLALSGFMMSRAIPRMLYEAQGPRPFTEDELRKLRDEPPEGLIAYDPPSLIDTGITKKSNQTVVARYMLAQVGRRWVFVRAPLYHSGNHLIGYLHVMDPTDSFHLDGLSLLDYSALEQVMKKFPDRPIAVYYFEVTGDRRIEWVKVVISVVFFLLCVWFVVAGGIFGRI
jgi:hypothetical protein